MKALNYKAFSNIKLRLGCSNIQGPKPVDLWLTSSKALIYYYNKVRWLCVLWADPQVQSEDKVWIIDLDKMDQRSGMSAKAFVYLTS